MKTKDLIIVLLAASVVVLGILYYNAISPPNSHRLKDVYNDEDVCFNPKESGQGFGKGRIGYIRQIIKAAKDPSNEIYGYQIEVKHIKQMCQDIRKYDLNPSNKIKVGGVRIYEAISTRRINGQMHEKADLVMLPYLENGEDVFLVDIPFFRPDFHMYAHFRPCPKLCKKKKIYIHQD